MTAKTQVRGVDTTTGRAHNRDMTGYRTLTDYKRTVTLDNGKRAERQVWADDGAVAQQGSKAVKECECGAKLVWLKSKRTGRSYLAECARYHTESSVEKWYYEGQRVHTHERCAQRVSARQEIDYTYRLRDARTACGTEFAQVVQFWVNLPAEAQLPLTIENLDRLRDSVHARIAAQYGIEVGAL